MWARVWANLAASTQNGVTLAQILAKLTGFSDKGHAAVRSTLGFCGSEGQNVIEALNGAEVTALA